ncbi:unnamed protein product [Amaranthus hypochondriacus]
MVWGLIPVSPDSGEKYFIYAKGTYKVGRKGCDVIINDKGVSRIHAELIIDSMEYVEPIEDRSSCLPSKVRIRDCSKYGTSIKRKCNIKEKLQDCPDKETFLEDGDLISFGTGTASFRFSYVPLVFYLCNFTSSQVAPSQDKVSSIGAHVAHKWTAECTHVIVDPFMPVTEEIIDVILSKKPLVLSTWLEIIATFRIQNDIPSYSQYIPTLTLEGGSVTVADSRTRENCLRGYTFVLSSANLYKFRDRVQLLLEAAGAKVLSVVDLDLKSQDQVEVDKFLVFVNPANSAERVNLSRPLAKVNEINVISSVISGYWDPSVLILPSIVISSSCSTDETVVEDSDADTETARSDHTTITNVLVKTEGYELDKKTLKSHPVSLSEDAPSADLMPDNSTNLFRQKEAPEYKSKQEKYVNTSTQEDSKVMSYLKPNRAVKTARNDDLEGVEFDICYSQNLVVRGTNTQVPTGSVTEGGVVNFKRFRKNKTQSGNSFSNLVPFSKHPYRDSDFDKNVSESMKEEKKRKKMEAMAEDLFNMERGRRRSGFAGSLRGLLNHS